MFEDFIRHKKYRQVGLKRSQYEHLVDLEIRHKLLREVETRRGRRIEPRAKRTFLRRVSEIIKSRPLPEETYETWHFRDGKVEEEPQPKKRKTDIGLKFNNLVDELVYEAGIIEKSKESEASEDEGAGEHENDNESENENEELDSQSDSDSDSDSDSNSDSNSDSDRDYDSGKDSDIEIEEENREDSWAQKKLRKIEAGLDTTRSWAKDRFILTKAGMEFSGLHQERASLIKQHATNVLNLLHINMLRQEWDLAYRAFCILVRFDFVDVRAIWPLGVEILTRRRENMIKMGTGSKLDFLKCRQFLDWLRLVYPVLPGVVLTKNSRVGPVFHSGSRRHAPAFVAASLWELLLDKRYTRVRETLEELLLVPPYSVDGSFHFIAAVCCLCENIHLADVYVKFDKNETLPSEEVIGDLADDMMLLGSKDAIQALILSNISKIEELLECCKMLKFEYPKAQIEDQMTRLKQFLNGNITSLAPEAPVTETSKTANGISFVHGVALETSQGPHVIPEKYMHRFVHPDEDMKISWVWRWFLKIEGETPSARCIKCQELIKRETSGSTKSLIRHLKKHGIDKDTRPVKQRIEIRPEFLGSRDLPHDLTQEGDKALEDRMRNAFQKSPKGREVMSKAYHSSGINPNDSEIEHATDASDSCSVDSSQAPSSPPKTAGANADSTSMPVLEKRHSDLQSDGERLNSAPTPPSSPEQPPYFCSPNDRSSFTSSSSQRPAHTPSEPFITSFEHDTFVSDQSSTAKATQKTGTQVSASELPDEVPPANHSRISVHSLLGDDVEPPPMPGPLLDVDEEKLIILEELNRELRAVEEQQLVPSPDVSEKEIHTPTRVPFSPETNSAESQRFMSVRRQSVRRQSNFSPNSTFAASPGDAETSFRFRNFAHDPFRSDRSELEDSPTQNSSVLGDINSDHQSTSESGEIEDIPDTLVFKEEDDPIKEEAPDEENRNSEIMADTEAVSLSEIAASQPERVEHTPEEGQNTTADTSDGVNLNKDHRKSFETGTEHIDPDIQALSQPKEEEEDTPAESILLSRQDDSIITHNDQYEDAQSQLVFGEEYLNHLERHENASDSSEGETQFYSYNDSHFKTSDSSRQNTEAQRVRKSNVDSN